MYTNWIPGSGSEGGRMGNASRSSALMAWKLVGLLALAAPLATTPLEAARAQTGNGFLFHRPQGTFTIRGGYLRANASSDIFAVQRKNLTVGPRDFDQLTVGGDLSFVTSRRVDFGMSVDVSTRSHDSEYRDWLDNNDQPIKQRTALSTFAMSASFKYNFLDRGRSISNLAWIPSRYVPYVGIGGGFMGYWLKQKGDFIDFTTNAVFSDELTSSAWSPMAQVFGGLAYTIGPRYSLISEARYTMSTANLNTDYDGRIDLSGLSLNVGTSIRF